jgi:molecular chaperone DnaJ
MIQPDPCQACRGRGTKRHPREFSVRLPPGSEHGAERVLAGQGEPGRFGGAWGDLRVTVNVRPHAFLTRSGTEIRCEVPISVTEAALGTRVEVPTLEGPVMVDVPRGIRSGTKLRLRKKGVPTSDRGRGDQLVSIAIETPAVFEGSPVEAALHELERVCSEHNGLPYRTRYRGTK